MDSPLSDTKPSVIALCWALYAGRFKGYRWATMHAVSRVTGTTHRTAVNRCVRQAEKAGLVKSWQRQPQKTIVTLTSRAVALLEKAWTHDT